MEIELFYWRGCPSYPEAQELVQQVVNGTAEIRVHEVRTQEEAEALRFPGSPTIRVDGVDVDPTGAEGRAMLACRIYRLPDGRVSPVPSREMLEEALR